MEFKAGIFKVNLNKVYAFNYYVAHNNFMMHEKVANFSPFHMSWNKLINM